MSRGIHGAIHMDSYILFGEGSTQEFSGSVQAICLGVSPSDAQGTISNGGD